MLAGSALGAASRSLEGGAGTWTRFFSTRTCSRKAPRGTRAAGAAGREAAGAGLLEGFDLKRMRVHDVGCLLPVPVRARPGKLTGTSQ